MTLQIVMICLKLSGTVSWPWFWALSPVWIEAMIVIGIESYKHLKIYVKNRHNKEFMKMKRLFKDYI